MKHGNQFNEWLAANADRACTWEDLGESCYSDIYKETHGFRPRSSAVPFATVGDLYKEINSLIESRQEEEQEEEDANDLAVIEARHDWLTIIA